MLFPQMEPLCLFLCRCERFAIAYSNIRGIETCQKSSKYFSHRSTKYTGVIGSIKGIRSVAHGKPVRMAWRNIFRDKKRAGVVLLSLFLGVTTFLTVTTLVFSTDVSKYIDSSFESDFVLKNSAWPTQKFDDLLIEQVQSIPGVENLHTTTWEEMRLDYSDDFREYIANHPMQEQITGLSEQAIADNFKGFPSVFFSHLTIKGLVLALRLLLL